MVKRRLSFLGRLYTLGGLECRNALSQSWRIVRDVWVYMGYYTHKYLPARSAERI